MTGDEHRPWQVILEVIGHRVVKFPLPLPSLQLNDQNLLVSEVEPLLAAETGPAAWRSSSATRRECTGRLRQNQATGSPDGSKALSRNIFNNPAVPAVARIDHFLINRVSVDRNRSGLVRRQAKWHVRQAPGDCLQVSRLCPGSTSIRFVEEATQEFASLVPIDARVGVPALDPQLIVQRLADDLEDGLLR